MVELLRRRGCAVYDYREPADGVTRFAWSAIDSGWEQWDARQFVDGLDHPQAQAGFGRDLAGLSDADLCVLVQPCGASAHLELGWAAGRGMTTCVVLDPVAPRVELMYRLADSLVIGLPGLEALLDHLWRACREEDAA